MDLYSLQIVSWPSSVSLQICYGRKIQYLIARWGTRGCPLRILNVCSSHSFLVQSQNVSSKFMVRWGVQVIGAGLCWTMFRICSSLALSTQSLQAICPHPKKGNIQATSKQLACPQILACTHREKSHHLCPFSFSFGWYVMVWQTLSHIFNRSVCTEGGFFFDFIFEGLGPICTQGTGYTGDFLTLHEGLFSIPPRYCDLTCLGKRLCIYTNTVPFGSVHLSALNCFIPAVHGVPGR